MFPKFIEDEGQYKESGKRLNMMNIKGEPRVFYNKPSIEVQTCYTEKGASDFLKCGGFFSVSDKVNRLFFEHGFQGVQLIPVLSSNIEINHGYSFMHKISTYDILDPIASEGENFDIHENYFTSILNLYLDKNKFNSINIQHDIFMCSNYFSEFICNERVKIALEAANVTGVEFDPVEFSS